MSNTKTINLDDEAYQIWQKKFKGSQEFSSWIQSKLKEEQEKEDSPEVLRSAIIDLTGEIEKLNARRALKQKRLELKLEEEHINSRAAIEEQERLLKNGKAFNEKLIQKIGAIMQYQLKIKMEREKFRELSTKLAEIYVLIPEPKPELKEFIEEEIKNEVPLL
jgi:predicted CopG family antitoxin